MTSPFLCCMRKHRSGNSAVSLSSFKIAQRRKMRVLKVKATQDAQGERIHHVVKPRDK